MRERHPIYRSFERGILESDTKLFSVIENSRRRQPNARCQQQRETLYTLCPKVSVLTATTGCNLPKPVVHTATFGCNSTKTGWLTATTQCQMSATEFRRAPMDYITTYVSGILQGVLTVHDSANGGHKGTCPPSIPATKNITALR